MEVCKQRRKRIKIISKFQTCFDSKLGIKSIFFYIIIINLIIIQLSNVQHKNKYKIKIVFLIYFFCGKLSDILP